MLACAKRFMADTFEYNRCAWSAAPPLQASDYEMSLLFKTVLFSVFGMF